MAAFNPARFGQPIIFDEAQDKELSTSDCRCRSHAFPLGRVVGAARQTLPRTQSAGLRSPMASNSVADPEHLHIISRDSKME
jgi:hypothetical protein